MTFLLRHAYVLLFAASLCEQLGAPLPSSPLLLGAGALARAGDMALPLILLLSVSASMLGHWVALAGGVALGLWLGWKIAQRHWLLRSLSIPRADPAAVAARLGSEAPPLIVDLRHELDLESRPTSLPGAVVVGPDELAQW